MSKQSRSFLLLTAAVLAASLGLQAPASAGPPLEQDHYDDVIDELWPLPEWATPEDPDPTFCGLRDVPVHIEESGYFSIKERGNSDYPYFANHQRSTRTFTNPVTGLTFTTVAVSSTRDLKIVDNGDGTITITANDTINQRVLGPDGELLFTDRGRVRFSFLIDTAGTLDPDDDVFLGEVGEPHLAGRHETFERDFCEDFLLFTGG